VFQRHWRSLPLTVWIQIRTEWAEISDTNAVFTALHEMQTRSSDENSVCLSVERVICDKTEDLAHSGLNVIITYLPVIPVYVVFFKVRLLVFYCLSCTLPFSVLLFHHSP